MSPPSCSVVHMSNTAETVTRHNLSDNEGALAVSITEYDSFGNTYFRVDVIEQGFLKDHGLDDYGQPIIFTTSEKVHAVYNGPSNDVARRVANAVFRYARRNGEWGQDALVAAWWAGIEEVAAIDCERIPGYSREEAIWNVANIAQGLCPDGCCGGPEVLEGVALWDWQKWNEAVTAYKRQEVAA